MRKTTGSTAKLDRRIWKRWMIRITDELIRSAVDRYIFDRWWSIIKANPRIDINNDFVMLIWVSYVERQVLAIRRQLKVDTARRGVSLVRLLQDIAAHATSLTRARFIGLHTLAWGSEKEHRESVLIVSKRFDTFAGQRMPHVSAARVQRDIKRLKSAARRLEYYSDKWLAHSDTRRRWPSISFQELDKVLILFEETARRYYVLACDGTYFYHAPSLVKSDWEEVLTFPWKT